MSCVRRGKKTSARLQTNPLLRISIDMVCTFPNLNDKNHYRCCCELSFFFLLFWLRDGKYFVTAVREGGQSLGRAHEISEFKCGSRGNLPPFMRLFWFWVTHGGGFLLSNPLSSHLKSSRRRRRRRKHFQFLLVYFKPVRGIRVMQQQKQRTVKWKGERVQFYGIRSLHFYFAVPHNN